MRNAIVTGGAGGLGGAICEALSRAGYFVGIFDRDGAAAEKFGANLTNSMSVQVDITDERSVADAMARFGRDPDVLVNNAGITAKGGLDQDVQTFERILRVNLLGAYVMTRAVVPGMIARRSGAIVNITSIAGTTAMPAGGAYGPSKAALANLTKAMALEYAQYGIRANAVAPGMINSGLGAGPASDPEVYAQRIAMVPAGELGSGRDIAEVVAFLASDAAHYVQGQEIIVDGALTLRALVNAVK